MVNKKVLLPLLATIILTSVMATVTITSPEPDSVHPPGNIMFTGVATDESGTGIKDVLIKDYPKPYEKTTPLNESWTEWTHDLNITEAGDHRILARVTDNAGNQSWNSMHITITESTEEEPAPEPSVTDCGSYDSASDSIVLTGCEVRISQLYTKFASQGLIEKESEGVYILKSNITVGSDAILRIETPDVSWLKIVGVHGVISEGKMLINGTKITSWDTVTNDVVHQNATGDVQRAWLIWTGDVATGYIHNSEVAYLGYHQSLRRGVDFVYGPHDVHLYNSSFHHNWYALYTNAAHNFVIDKNEYFENHYYALDPHTDSFNFTISNNHVHHNERFGIIGSFRIWNFDIFGNTVHDNGNSSAGIMLSRLMRDSKVHDNEIWNENTAISISASFDNEVFNNTIHDAYRGILIQDTEEGNADGNWIHDNSFQNVSYVVVSRGGENRFTDNQLVNIQYYYILLTGGGIARVDEQVFNGDRMRSSDSTNSVVIIERCGVVDVDGTNYDTDSAPAQFTLNSQTITLNTVSPSSNAANIL